MILVLVYFPTASAGSSGRLPGPKRPLLCRAGTYSSNRIFQEFDIAQKRAVKILHEGNHIAHADQEIGAATALIVLLHHASGAHGFIHSRKVYRPMQSPQPTTYSNHVCEMAYGYSINATPIHFG